MAWDKTLPADTTELRLGPGYIRDNWDAIETADTSLLLTGVNLDEQAGDLSLNASTYRLFAKSANGNTELFGINSAGNVAQLTRGAPSPGASGYTFLPGTTAAGGLRLVWGRSSGISNNGTITVSDLTTIYQATFTIEDSSATPASRAYISSIATNVITVKVPTGGTVVLRWFAIGV